MIIKKKPPYRKIGWLKLLKTNINVCDDHHILAVDVGMGLR